VEKVPLLLLAVISSVVTYAVQQRGGAVGAFGQYPLHERIGNALISYVSYLAKAVWPSRLAIFYPYPVTVPVWRAVGAALLLTVVTIWIVRKAKLSPYLAVGWLWYLGSLVPVIGIVQVGGQAMADRYSYIPLIGFFMAIAWGIQDFLGLSNEATYNRANSTRPILALLAGIVIAVLAFATRVQVDYWKNSITVFTHALEVTDYNHVAHGNLGQALWKTGRTDDAIAHFRQAVAIQPSEVSHNMLGGALLTKRLLKEAEAELSIAVSLKPDYATAQFNLGIVLVEQGRPKEAIDHYKLAIAAEPEFDAAHTNLGRALASIGNTDEALIHFKQALAINPEDSATHNYFGNVLAAQGKFDEALAHFNRALQNAPGDAPIHFKAGDMYEKLGRNKEAIAEFEAALRIKPGYPPAQQGLEKARGK
jgi:tetratricopeptide (TPR) repeat protein